MTLKKSIPFWAKKKNVGQTPIPDKVFSFRKVVSSYNGPCLQVRRDSDGTFIPVGFIDGYVDTAAISSFCAGTVGRLRVWFDQGDPFNLRYVANDSVGAPIIFQAGNLVTFGGKLAALFGLNTPLSTFENNLPSNYTVKSIFAVSKANAISIINYIMSGPGSGLALAGTFGEVQGLTLYQGSTKRVGNTFENTNRTLSTFINTPLNGYVWSNGANMAVSSGSFPDPIFNRVGRADSNLSLNGLLQEIFIFDTDKTAERVTIESEINTYYSIY